MKRWLKYALIAGGIGLLAGGATAWYLFNLKSDDLSKAKPDYTLSAVELITAFESSEAEATTRYGGKIIQVGGTITSTVQNADGSYNVLLGEDAFFTGVLCTLAAGFTDTAEITPGAVVSLRGQCNGMLMDVSLTNCVLVSKE